MMNKGVVYALWGYEAQNSDELSFHEGDAITILRRKDESETEWWWARLGDREGYVPKNLLGVSTVRSLPWVGLGSPGVLSPSARQGCHVGADPTGRDGHSPPSVSSVLVDEAAAAAGGSGGWGPHTRGAAGVGTAEQPPHPATAVCGPDSSLGGSVPGWGAGRLLPPWCW